MNNSMDMARLIILLDKTLTQIMAETVPLLLHLKADNNQLCESLEEAARAIKRWQNETELAIVPARNKTGAA